MTSSSRERLYRRGAAGAPLHRRNQTTQVVTSRVGNANHPPTCPLCPDAVGVRALQAAGTRNRLNPNLETAATASS